MLDYVLRKIQKPQTKTFIVVIKSNKKVVSSSVIAF